MANPFVHIELHTKDIAKAKDFYSKLFDWKLTDVPMPGDAGGTYTLIDVGGGTGGGMFQNPDGPPRWVAYVAVEDIAAATRKARELGANIVQDVTSIGEHGWFSMMIDPTGAIFALWQEDQASK